jgi:diamine N-acetyltransferase
VNLHLIKIDESETGLIADLADRIWHAYYAEFISLQQIDYMLDKFYGQASLLEQIDQGQQFYKIMDSTDVMGFVSISQKEDSEFFIHKFYILPEKHGKHIGSKVMDMLRDLMVKNSKARTTRIRLTVNRQNYKAINFYFKNGFIIEKVEDFDIGNGYFMNDFVMLFKGDQ